MANRPIHINHNFTVFLVLAFGSILLLIAGHTTKYLEPVEATLRWVVKPITFIANLPRISTEIATTYFVAREELQSRNEDLSKQASRLNNTAAALKQAQETIKELSIALEYRQASESEHKLAEIIDYVPTQLRHEVIINLGEQHGVSVNDVVLDSWGLFGRVTETYSRASLVMLISDERHGTPVLVRRTRHYFIASGSGANNKLMLDNVNLSVDIEVGDELVTSGLGGVFPEGIVVGRIDDVTDNVAESARIVTVTPYARLNAKSYLHVLEKDTFL